MCHVFLLLCRYEISSSIWLGITDTLGGSFAYSDGTPIDYANWASNEPSMARECVTMSTAGQFYSADCSMTQAVLCQVDKGQATAH